MKKSATVPTCPTRLAKRPASYLLFVTILISCISCSAKRAPVHVDFTANWEGQPLLCTDAEIALTDMRFFVSNVVLIDSAGGEHEIQLTPDAHWQQHDVTLIDLENGDGSCMNGTPDMNRSITGKAASADFVGIQFTVGVPFELNHANPLLAEAPLNDAAMHWHWRSGYKFLRAGLSTPTDGFWVHLGSTGCEGTTQNISKCRFPNRVRVELLDFSPVSDQIAIELSELFRNVDLDDGNRSDCSSSPAETSCENPFDALGLLNDAADRQQAQRVFRVNR